MGYEVTFDDNDVETIEEINVHSVGEHPEEEAIVYKYKVGDRVSATVPSFNGDYFDGNITKLVKNGDTPTYEVTFDDNDVETIEEINVHSVGEHPEEEAIVYKYKV